MGKGQLPTRVAKWTAVVLVLSILFASAAIGTALYLRQESITETQRFTRELRNGLVKSCARSGNPLREAVQHMLREQVQRSDPATIRRYFPQIPSSELNRLLREQREANEATIRRIAPVNCKALYPK
jgi:hypothetical protein